jgi:hypothetical protein
MLDDGISLPRSAKPLSLGRISSLILSIIQTRAVFTFQSVADAVIHSIGDETMTHNNERTLRR